MKKFKSYSQYGEDYFVWKYFGQKNNGLIIEIGAFDGKYFSTSFALNQIGWKSICIEPNPKAFGVLRKNRPKADCINMALVGDEHQKSTTFHTEPLGLYSGIQPNKNLDATYKYFKQDLALNEVTLAAATLNKVLQEAKIEQGQIDCITIDVEGTELEILNGFDIQYYQPKLLIIEANNAKEEEELKAHLLKNKYHFLEKTGVNLIFSNQPQLPLIDTSSNELEPAFQMHPFGIQFTEQSPLFIKKYPKRNLWFKRIQRYWNKLKQLFR